MVFFSKDAEESFKEEVNESRNTRLEKIINECVGKCLRKYLAENARKQSLNEFLSKQGVKIWQRFKPNGMGNANGDRKEYNRYVRKERQKNREKGKKTDVSIYFQPIRVVHNEWLIHFCGFGEAESIAKNGFKGSALTKTPYSSGSGASRKGYNYAFLMSDIVNDSGEGREIYNFISSSGVIFKANGVLGYHYGDKNRQVIFYGNDVKEILFFHDNILYNKYGKPIFKGNKVHGINGNEYGFWLETLTDDYNWLVNNGQQYRKQID